MPTFTYAAPDHHVLEYDEGKTVKGGEDFTVSDERATQLLADTSIPIKEATQALSKLTKNQLVEIARERGVPDPESPRTKDELVEAIEHAPLDHTTTEES